MRLTMVVDGARSAVEQVTKQLYKVVEVRKVSDLTDDARVERELALIKVSCKAAPQRAEVMQIADIYRARVVDVAAGADADGHLSRRRPRHPRAAPSRGRATTDARMVRGI